jgi:single-strand DNA-binding protein
MTEDTNVVTVIGRLTKDAELRQNQGLSVGFFSIAVNRKKKDGPGGYTEEASYFDISVYGKYAATITPRLKKGTAVCVTGSLKQERWADASGQKKSRVVIAADSVQIIGGKNNGV